MTPALKSRIMGNLSNRRLNTAQAVATPLEVEPTTPTEVEPTPPTEAEAVQPSQPTLTNGPSDSQHHVELSDDDMSDALSYCSSLPDVFEVGSDDSAPLATGPWTIIDHFTGEMMVDDDEIPPATPAPPGPPLDSTIQVEVILGNPVLIQTPLPTLLFVDQDVRPNWLLLSTNEFLQHVPYYMCLSRVVDLFFAQEAKLGYPAKVS